MKVGQFTKQPAERISNSIKYDDALDVGDYIETIVSCTASPAGLSVNAGLRDSTSVRIWYEGGEAGKDYKVTTRVTTNQGEVFEDEVICKVREV